MTPRYPNRVSFAHLPTPVEKLERLSKHLGGPELLIKRDDQTGLALGGNKTRKLEFLTADALAQGCDHLITTGGATEQPLSANGGSGSSPGAWLQSRSAGQCTQPNDRQFTAQSACRRSSILDRRTADWRCDDRSSK